MSLQARSFLFLVLVALIWGSGFIATEYAIRSGMPTEGIMALRFSSAALALGILNRKKLKTSPAPTARRGIVAGLILFSAFYAQTIGQGLTTVSHTAFLTATNVVMIPFFLWFLEKRKPPTRITTLSAVVLFGVGLMSLKPEEGFAVSPGDPVVLLCAALFALHIIYVGKYCLKDDPTLVTFWQLLAAAAVSILLMLLMGKTPRADQLAAGLPPALYLGLFSTCLCYFLQTHAQQHVPPAQAGIALSLEGVFGTLFSILLGLEALRLNVALGGVLITASVIGMQLGEKGTQKKEG